MRVSGVVCLWLCVVASSPVFGAGSARGFDGGRAYGDLVRQCEFGPRVPGTRGHVECAGWLEEELGASADGVEVQRFTAVVGGEAVPLSNIVAMFEGKGQGHVLLCAHWDTRPRADQDPDPGNRGKPIAGANDGASGVAVLLEVARALKAHPPRQRVTIVLFDGEDYGATAEAMYLGSKHFAATYAGPEVEWGVLLDMVGDRDLRIRPERFSVRRAPGVVERVWAAAERVGAKGFVREPGPAILDDHVPLLERGIPCIDVIDFEYPYWHTVGDTPDKCSAASLGEVGRTVLEALGGPAG